MQRLNPRFKALAGLYRRHPQFCGTRRCTYCGDIADTTDHVPNLAFVHAMGVSNVTTLWLVDACRECNILLGTSNLTTIPERKAQIADKLSRKYRELINTPHWDEMELGQLGVGLYTHIAYASKLASYVKRRIAIAKDRIELN